jgi:hypothetical protein
MASQTAVQAEGTLEVNQRSWPGELQIGHFPAFLQEIKLKQPGLAARRNLHDGEATAIQGHAVAGLYSPTANPGDHGQLDGPGRRLYFFNDACFFNNACEHINKLCCGQDGVEAVLIHSRSQE